MPDPALDPMRDFLTQQDTFLHAFTQPWWYWLLLLGSIPLVYGLLVLDTYLRTHWRLHK